MKNDGQNFRFESSARFFIVQLLKAYRMMIF